MQPIIRVQGLSKRYRIAHAASGAQGSYRTLREDLVRLAGAPLRRLRGGDDGRREDFWALRDVNFEVQPGEVVGIIGRNGTGKSTLLKILSRITKPTSGQAELRGRVGSLLEVGTGFHPELTGRENIFLNGAILGMSRREITAKFDEIVAFSEIERFLDTPVKRYSSGMYVRLAFAVAAYLEPEILIIDEVLAVGDLAFQRKCLGTMESASRSGRTIIFVSHNMPAVEALCNRAVLMDGGRPVLDGPVPQAVAAYRRQAFGMDHSQDVFTRPDPNRVRPILRGVELLDECGLPAACLAAGETFRLRIDLEVPDLIELPTIGLGIDDVLGQRMLTLHTPLSESAVPQLVGRCSVNCAVDRFPLVPGEYWIKVAVSARGNTIDTVERALRLIVAPGELFGEGRGFHRGICLAPSRWRMGTMESESVKGAAPVTMVHAQGVAAAGGAGDA